MGCCRGTAPPLPYREQRERLAGRPLDRAVEPHASWSADPKVTKPQLTWTKRRQTARDFSSVSFPYSLWWRLASSTRTPVCDWGKLMKVLALAAALACVVSTANADQFVNGYVRRDGAYVQPHIRSTLNGNPFDNYSTRGNANPYTGQVGTHSPYGSQSPYASGSGGLGGFGAQPRTPCYGLNCR